MFCVKCGKEFQGNGYVCPECLAAEAAQQPPVEEIPQSPVEPVASEMNEPQSAELDQGEGVVDMFAATAPAEAPTPMPELTPGFTLSTPEEKPKKAKGKKKAGLWIGLGVLALVLIVGGVILALNWNNWFGKDKPGIQDGVIQVPEEPGEYIAYLYQPRMEAISGNLKDGYGAWKESGVDGRKFQTDISLEIGEDILGLLSEALKQEGLDMELDWLSQINLEIVSNTAPGCTAESYTLALALGDTHILSANAAWTAADKLLYITVPEINKKPMSLSLPGLLGQKAEDLPLEEALALEAEMKENMPDQDAVGEMADGFVDILMKYLTEYATKETQTISVGEAEQEVTVLRVELTSEVFYDLIAELLAYAKDNEALRQIVTAYGSYVVDYYDLLNIPYATDTITVKAYEKGIDELLEELELAKEEAQEGEALIIDTYVNGGDILGLRLSATHADGEEEEAVFFATLIEDKTRYFTLQVTDMVEISGEATEKNGKLSGEFLLEVEGDTYLELELKNVDTTTGYGTYILSPEAQLLELLELDGLVSTLASTVSVELELDDSYARLAVKTGKATVLAVEAKTSIGEGEEVQLPTNAVRVDGMMGIAKWTQSMNLDQVVQSLKDAGFPKKYYSVLEMLASQFSSQS